MNTRRLLEVFRWTVAAAALAGIVLVYSRWLHVNQVTVALTLLLLVLTLAANWGLRHAVVTAIAATLAYNFFFLPPIGHITIADSENWLALFVFLATAVVGSRLSQRARDEAREARERQREIGMAFAMGRELLQYEDVGNLLRELPVLIARATNANGVALYLLEGDQLWQHGAALVSAQVPHLRQVALTLQEADTDGSEVRIPVMAGVRPRGLLVLSGMRASRETLQTFGGLVSISLDRAQALADLARGEAAKEGERLRTLIIDSITHELRTPLTSIKGAASALRDNRGMPDEARHELIEIVDEESDRLNLLVERATEMNQLDSHQVHMTFAAVDVAEVLRHARQTCASTYPDHPIQIVADPLPEVSADAEFLEKVLCNMLENAAKYSAPGSQITLSASREGDDAMISVADRGIGIDPSEQALVFDRFYRSRTPKEHVPGTGMGLAISKAIIEAHGGTVSLTSQPGSGSVFSFTVPLASLTMTS